MRTLLLILALAIAPRMAAAECAVVKIEIVQELTFERQAFDASMRITNGLANPLEDVRVDISITDALGADRGAEFFVRLETTRGLSGQPDGSGTVGADAQTELHWLIIPSFGTAGPEPAGTAYEVGATLSYTLSGREQVVEVAPDTIHVMPMPLLVLDYFQPSFVLGDDPFTAQQESPVPYTLGVRVSNVGFGPAPELRIDSGQPRIVENERDVLIAFRILASEVNGAPAVPSLLVDFGDLEAGRAGTARWQMISTLSGQFVGFDVTFTHDDELGGALTSLIDSTNAHFLVHDVRVDLPGRDGVRDFLATESNVLSENLRVYESDGGDARVEVLLDVTASGFPRRTAPAITLTTPIVAGPAYIRLRDPGGGASPLVRVVRADGKELAPDNFWIAGEFQKETAETHHYIGIFDIDTRESYQLVYDVDPASDTTPPVTRVVLTEPHAGEAPVCVTHATELIFVSEDNRGLVDDLRFLVEPSDPLDAGAYGPATNPFRFAIALPEHQGDGPKTVGYYAIDRQGNAEAPKTIALRLDASAPTVGASTLSVEAITPDAPPEALALRAVEIAAAVDDLCGPIRVTAEITGPDGAPVRSLSGNFALQSTARLLWDGRDDAGAYVAPGTYAIRLRARDALYAGVEDDPHESANAPVTVRVERFLPDDAADAFDCDQLAPDVEGDVLVWQDDREGRWQVYARDLSGAEAAAPLDPESLADQTDPAISAAWIAWVDRRTGEADIAVYERATGALTVLALAGEQAEPDLDGDDLVFTSRDGAGWNVIAHDLTAGVSTTLSAHARDQLHPRVSQRRVVWEDHRLGAPDVYQHDLTTGVTLRVTEELATHQERPALAGDELLWEDNRHGGTSEIHRREPDGVRRLTYGPGRRHSPDVHLGRFVAVTEVDGATDLLWGSARSGAASAFALHAGRQRHPRLHASRVVWEDDRSGRWQVRHSRLPEDRLVIAIAEGFNLLALPASVTALYPTAADLLAAWSAEHGVTAIAQLDETGAAYRRVEQGGGGNFALRPDLTLFVTGSRAAQWVVEVPAAPPELALVEGLNGIGLVVYPFGYRASDLVGSLGAENVRQLQRFDASTGSFATVALDAGALVGEDFALRPGEGLLVQLAQARARWRP